MNVRELISALSRLDPDMPVIIENDSEYYPDNVEITHVRVVGRLSRDPVMSARYGANIYDYVGNLAPSDPRVNLPTPPVVILGWEQHLAPE